MLSINIIINAPAAEWTPTKLRLMTINFVSCIMREKVEASINTLDNGNVSHVAWISISQNGFMKANIFYE